MDARAPLRIARHTLVRLEASAWQAILRRPWDAQTAACIAHWAERDLPLVVARRRDMRTDDAVALGLPAPLQWARRKIALDAARAELRPGGDWPALSEIADEFDPPVREALNDLDRTLRAPGAGAAVYGGYGWQRLTGLSYMHPASDLDLLIDVRDDVQADAVAAALDLARTDVHIDVRIDGELLWPTGEGIAWYEWLRMRRGQTRQALVKRIDGVGFVERVCAAGAAR